MTQITGGLRARLIRDSFVAWLEEGLDSLGWFDGDRRHAAITLTTTPLDWDEPIEPNLIAITSAESTDDAVEEGSSLTEDKTQMLVDLLAESAALGTEVIFDVRDLMAGRMSFIGRGNQSVVVYDYRQATPTPIFNVHLTNVSAAVKKSPRHEHWYQASCLVVSGTD